jgi:hypothetical protein
MSTTLLDSSPKQIEPAGKSRQVFNLGKRTALELP